MYKIGTSGPWTLGVEHLCYEYSPYWTGLIKKTLLERFQKSGTYVVQARIALSSFFYCLAQQLSVLGDTSRNLALYRPLSLRRTIRTLVHVELYERPADVD